MLLEGDGVSNPSTEQKPESDRQVVAETPPSEVTKPGDSPEPQLSDNNPPAPPEVKTPGDDQLEPPLSDNNPPAPPEVKTPGDDQLEPPLSDNNPPAPPEVKTPGDDQLELPEVKTPDDQPEPPLSEVVTPGDGVYTPQVAEVKTPVINPPDAYTPGESDHPVKSR